MGAKRLPRDPEEQKLWARRLASRMALLPIACFRSDQHRPISSYYPRLVRGAYELGAQTALEEILKELALPDDPCEGLPPHLVKSAKAAAAGAARRRRAAEQQSPPAPRRSQSGKRGKAAA